VVGSKFTHALAEYDGAEPDAVERFVAVAALPVQDADEPEVFWLPAVFTPGKLMFAEPLKDTPPIVLAVCKVVAVAALPEHDAAVVALVALVALVAFVTAVAPI
jgi:hypothetical protein